MWIFIMLGLVLFFEVICTLLLITIAVFLVRTFEEAPEEKVEEKKKGNLVDITTPQP